MTTTLVNTIHRPDGRAQAVCEFCGRTSRPVRATDGRVSFFDLPIGWSVAPFSDDVVHQDGSTGSFWQCPTCSKALARGEALRTRGGQKVRKVG